jgi:3-oxoacyl-(acyl-carrier-protein) synthase
MYSPMEEEKFKQGLVDDLANAQAMAKQGSAAKNVEDPEFEPRAFRVQNKVIGEKEMSQARRTINKTIEDLLGESGIVDEIEENKFRINMQRKMNKFKMMAIRSALEAERMARMKNMDQEKSQALMRGIAGAVGGIAQMTVSRMGKTTPEGFDSTQMSGKMGGGYKDFDDV